MGACHAAAVVAAAAAAQATAFEHARTLLYSAAKAGVPVRLGLFITVPPSQPNSATKGRWRTEGKEGRRQRRGEVGDASGPAAAPFEPPVALRPPQPPSHPAESTMERRTWQAAELPVEKHSGEVIAARQHGSTVLLARLQFKTEPPGSPASPQSAVAPRLPRLSLPSEAPSTNSGAYGK